MSANKPKWDIEIMKEIFLKNLNQLLLKGRYVLSVILELEYVCKPKMALSS